MWVLIGIIALVVALAAGPVMWIRPSPRQKQVASYRQTAAQLGLRVKLVPLKSIGISQEILTAKDGLPFYGTPWDLTNPQEKHLARSMEQFSWCLIRGTYEHGAHFMGVWDWGTDKQAHTSSYPALKEFLTRLPDDVIACECTGQGVSLGWLEKGKVERVQEISNLLKSFKKACLTQTNIAKTTSDQNI